MSVNVEKQNLREICTCNMQQLIGGTLAELAEHDALLEPYTPHLGSTKPKTEKKSLV